ncbi:unnamed protein product [Durusdinium trenchii]|uniref:Ubiquitin-like domain-containing protein n=2 Tax=Durusdinium trenchii TaxID=1381693 RepID=A0ABP0T1F6_9DINO
MPAPTGDQFDLFKAAQEEDEEGAPPATEERYHHGRETEDEVNITIHAGYWGEGSQAGCATTVKVSSNGIARTLTFFPGVDHGAVRVEGEPDADIGFSPGRQRYHILHLTMRQTGTHTFSISDGGDCTNTWSMDFRLHGWLDDLYGAAAVSIFDPEDRELELGHELTYQSEGEHKLRLVTLGTQVYETDELDPQGWVSFNRTCLEPVDKANTKASRHPTCHLKVKDRVLEKRLYPGRWHSLTVTVDSVRDEMCLYLDGIAVDKPIDIFESSFGRTGGGGGFGREGGKDRRKGVSEGPTEYEAYAGFGYSFASPFAVPQEGFLLFASSSIRSMPGGTKLRKAIFRNSILTPKAIEDQYVSSRHKKRPVQIPQSLTLAPIMKKKAIPLWVHGSYVAEFCNPFVPAAGGSPLHLYSIFCMALDGVVEKMSANSLWTPADVNGCKRVLGLFRELELLMKKWHQLWTCTAADQLSALSAIYLRRLAQARAELQPGGRLLVPLGIRLQRSSQLLMLIVERKGSGNYRFLVVNSSPIGLAYHATDASRPPKIRYRVALELDDIPAARAEDEGFWMMLVVTAVQPCHDQLPLYDKLLPWLAGSPLEHLLATVNPTSPATQEWRSPQCANTDGWRYLTFSLRVLLLEVGGFSSSKAKLLKWHLREQLLSFAANDLAAAQSLSVSEKRLLRLGLSQLSLAAVKVSGNLELEASRGVKEMKATSMAVLGRAQAVVKDVEAAVERKPRPYGFEDPSVLPLLDLLGGASEPPAHDWGLHPFFERLLREQRSPGQKVGIPLLVPINLLEMPETIPDLEAAVRALRLAEELCAKLCFVGYERCKFSNFLRVALLQHVFTELMPLPLGPLAEKPPLNLTDPVWAPNGSNELHPQLTRGGQLELMQVLLRLAEHFVSAACGLHASGGFDGVKIVVLGAIAAIADRVLRIRTVLPGIPKPQREGGPIVAEAEPCPSLVSDLLNGVGGKGWKPMAIDPTSFMRQSETIEAVTPEISVARTAVASYFTEVKKNLQVPSGKDQTLFDWDQHGWMLWVNKESGLKKLVQTICSHHLLQAGGGWADLAAGSDPYLVHTWPEFQCYRDIIFYWKYFLCTDLRVFPKVNEYVPQSAYLKWQVVDEQKAFGCPPNRGKVFLVSALGKEHLLKHDVPPHRPKPPASGLRWPSAALPSHHTKTPVRTEDDLLYMRSLPTFNEMLRASDSEALLSFLTVPYIRMPLVLAFFTTGDRVNSLFDQGLQQILQAVILEPGKLLEPMNWAAAPENVPANSSAEQELVASPYGQLLTELACAPGCLLAYLAKLLELALVLANSAMSQTVGTILFTLRVAARVESSAVYLLQHSEGKLPSTGPRPGALPSSAWLLHELRAGRERLRAIFAEAEGWLDAWLEELHDLACKAAAAAGEEGGAPGRGTGPQAKNKAQQSLDQYMKTSCNIHAHLLLLLRNVPEEELDERSVSRILSSFAFLSLHHTFNQNFLDIPETELFEIFQHHRRGLVRWFEKQRKNNEYGRFNRVLQEVHQQFSTIDSSSSVDTALFEWGVVKGDFRNAGRYAIVGPKRSEAERGEVATTASNDNAWIELNIQLLQVTVRGRHVTPLEADTCEDGDFVEVLSGGAGKKAETVQCAALLSTNLVRVRELLSQPYRITRWEGMAAANLPFTGDYVRLYDMEDFEEHEAWVPQLFEPVRLKFFVPPAVPQPILFFLLEETDPSASVIVLAAVHPKVRGKVWKEVMVFRDLRSVQIFKIDSYGHQHYRSLEYTTNARYCLAEKQPSPNDREDPWPDWGRYEAGQPDLNMQDKPPTVVMSRTIVKDVHSDGSAGAGTGKKDPLDDSEEWSDGEPSDDETEQERKERTVWERSQKEGEQYLPKRLLKGLLPEGLLEKYFIYQENETPWRAIRGYPKTPEGEEDRDPDHLLEIKLIKVGKVPCTAHRGWCALVRKRWKAAGRKPWFLLNLLYAKEGTPLHSLARTLVRLENLSFILAWTEQDPRKVDGALDPPIDFIELPRLLLSFTVRRGADGSRGLWSLDHAELSVPLGAPSYARTQAAKLLEPMPHSLLLQTSNAQFFALLPNIKVHRPHVDTDPFSTELVLERGNSEWWGRAKNKTFLYPVHASRSFLQTPTLASALYVMMLRWMNRDYRGVAALVSAVGTDSKYEEDEMQIFKHLGRITDPHPDSHANRLQVSLAVSDANMELPWDLLDESAGYLGKLAHVTARSRLSEDYELRSLQLCQQIRKCLEIIENEVSLLRQRWWGQWGAARIKRFVELLESEKERKLANFQEAQEVEQWLRQLTRKMRASQLPQTKEEIRSMALKVFGDYNVDPNVELALDNRSKYLERLGGRDGARPGEPLQLHCPHRARESLWQTHQDQNVLLCSLFDLLWEVLGAEKVLRRDVEEDEGPEIPMMRRLPFPMAINTAFEMCQGKMTLKDYGSAPKTWAFLYSLFTLSTGARLSRAKETNPAHQQTYTTLLLHLMPGSRHHGVLASLLHILAQNPNICDSMPMLTKPKKVRLVGQWKAKLTEIHQFVVQAADAMKLAWPPTPESFQELPRPMQSAVESAWFQRCESQQGGLCARLLFAPELPAEGACLLGCPSLKGLTCTQRFLEGTVDMPSEEVAALATMPMRHLAREHLIDTPPSSLLPEEMPFDLSKHPTAKHRVAISMLSRLDREVQICARMRNARQKPALISLQSESVKAIANGDQAALGQARDQMARLREELLKLKAKDEEFVAMAINKSFSDANDIDLGSDPQLAPLRDRLRFWLLRYSDLEVTLWFEHLCCGLLSPEAELDFARLNPFLKPEAAAGLLSRLTQMMLVAGRIIQPANQDLADLLANPDSAGSAVALAAGLSEKLSAMTLSSATMAKLRVIALSGEEVREITMTDLGEETPISELLQRCAEPQCRIKLLFEGQELKPCMSLSEAGLQSGDTLTRVVCPKSETELRLEELFAELRECWRQMCEDLLQMREELLDEPEHDLHTRQRIEAEKRQQIEAEKQRLWARLLESVEKPNQRHDMNRRELKGKEWKRAARLSNRTPSRHCRRWR